MADPVWDDLESLRRDLGTELRWGTDEALTLQKLPLGIATLDAAISGGIAFNRITEVIGEASAGKTVLTYLAMKAAQARGLPCAYIDAERAWDPTWAQSVGVDPAKVLVAEPRTGEAAFDVAVALVKTQPAGVLVIDSLAALTAAAEIEENVGMGQQFIGLQARLINRGLRTLTVENTGWAILAINQLRSSVGVTYGNPETLPGGKGQNFFAWQIIRVRRGAWIEEGTGAGRTKRTGYNLRIQMEKNKQGRPFAEAEVPFYFTGEVDEVAGLVDQAVVLKVFGEGKGGRYEWDGERIHGRRALADFFRTNAEAQEALRQKVAETAVTDLDF